MTNKTWGTVTEIIFAHAQIAVSVSLSLAHGVQHDIERKFLRACPLYD